jgi:hypothetical protein
MRRPFALGLAFMLLTLSRPAAAQTEPRQRRQSPPQHQVERSIAYFVGRWRVEYVGGEFPPLGAGSRSGTVTLSRLGASNFVAGPFDGELLGKPFNETQLIGFDPDTNALMMLERRPDRLELVSLGQWRSPLAMTFQTMPMQANGRTYQLRRVISVTSDVAFEVTEEFSVDGGAFRRLGNGHYTKQP